MHKTYKTYKTYKIMMGAPVFALTGYAVASHVIPRGIAVPLFGMAQVQSYHWGTYCNRRTNHLTNLIILIILTSATRWV